MIQPSLIEHYQYASTLSTNIPSKRTLMYTRLSQHQLLPQQILVKRYDLSGLKLKKQRLIDAMQQLRGRWESYNHALWFELEQETFVIAEQHFDNLALDAIINEDWQIDLSFMSTIAQAVQDLHARGLTHGNIKPENVILMEDPLKIKLNDANIPYMTYLLRKKEGNTDRINYYAAPEVSNEQIIAKSADVWSLGIVFFEMLTHRRIHSFADRFKDSEKFPIKLLREIKCMKLRNLLQNMLEPNFHRRITLSDTISFLKTATYIEDVQQSIDSFPQYINRQLLFPIFTSAEYHKGPFTLDKREGRSNRPLSIQRKTSNLNVIFKYNQKMGMLIMKIWQDTFPCSHCHVRFRYEDLPKEFRKRYVSCYQLFKTIVMSSDEDYSLSTAGELILRVREKWSQQRVEEVKKEDPNKQKVSLQPKKTKQQIVQPVAAPSMISSPISSKFDQNTSQLSPKKHKNDNPSNIKDQSDDQTWINKQIYSAKASLLYFHQKISSFQVIPLIEEELEIIKLQEDLSFVSPMLENIGNLFAEAKDYKNAVFSYELARKGYIAASGQNSLQQIILISNLALYLFQQQQYSKSQRLIQKSMQMARQKGQPEDAQTVKSYILLARTHARRDNHASAGQNYIKSMRLANSLSDPILKFTTLCQMASFYFEIKEYKKSISLWQIGAKQIGSLKNSEMEKQKAAVFYNLARTQLQAGQIEASLRNFCIALKVRINDQLVQSIIAILKERATKLKAAVFKPLLKELLQSIPGTNKKELTNLLLH